MVSIGRVIGINFSFILQKNYSCFTFFKLTNQLRLKSIYYQLMLPLKCCKFSVTSKHSCTCSCKRSVFGTSRVIKLPILSKRLHITAKEIYPIYVVNVVIWSAPALHKYVFPILHNTHGTKIKTILYIKFTIVYFWNYIFKFLGGKVFTFFLYSLYYIVVLLSHTQAISWKTKYSTHI